MQKAERTLGERLKMMRRKTRKREKKRKHWEEVEVRHRWCCEGMAGSVWRGTEREMLGGRSLCGWGSGLLGRGVGVFPAGSQPRG